MIRFKHRATHISNLDIAVIKNKQAINKINKNIPNSLLVTDRKTAYNGKKYHSGTICEGVTRKLAFS